MPLSGGLAIHQHQLHSSLYYNHRTLQILPRLYYRNRTVIDHLLIDRVHTQHDDNRTMIISHNNNDGNKMLSILNKLNW